MARTRKYYLKKQLFDIEVKVPRRSLRYATHRLMVMHPHTKYNLHIWKDKKVMVWRRSGRKMSPFVRRGDIIMEQHTL